VVYVHNSACVRYVKNIPFIGYRAYVLNSAFVRVCATCAIVLGCELEELIEPEWREWKEFSDKTSPQPRLQRRA
jgi:hypothetical protein